MILVVVVALAALGILMVYSSSALKGYLADGDTFATVGPQIQWAVLGIVAMLVMMRVDYRYLRLASVPLYIAGRSSRSRCCSCPSLSIVVGGSARWLKLGRAAGRPPGGVRQAGADRLPRPLVREARARRPAACGPAPSRSC